MPLTYKILNARDNQNKTTSLQIVQITTITPGANSYLRVQRLWYDNGKRKLLITGFDGCTCICNNSLI